MQEKLLNVAAWNNNGVNCILFIKAKCFGMQIKILGYSD